MYFVAAVLAVLSGLFYAAGITSSALSAPPCANMAARSAITRSRRWSPPFSPRCGVPSSASAERCSSSSSAMMVLCR